MNLPSCPDCGASRTQVYTIKQGLRLLQCGPCRLIWLDNPAIESESFQDAYPSAYFEGYERRWQRKFATDLKRLKWLARFHKPGSSLDIGCSVGHFVAAARSLGWNACGVEPSQAATALARQKGLNVACGFLEEIGFPESGFDMVSLWHVLEHVPYPRHILEEVFRILAPDGIIVLATPNIAHPFARLMGSRWRHIHSHHLYYFTPDSLKSMLRSAGFRIEACQAFGWHTPMLVVARAMKAANDNR
ncbi:MAG: class I SAM-dependent methyltransferase [Armatimonadetes bacterium]|nr:class I SAM-dependent methyltransferase [Armatimonadota bacterium]